MKNTHSPKALFLSGLLFLAIILATPTMVLALASNNVPLDSPIYSYLEKLASFGLLTSDFRGIRPMTKAEVARLLLEAERNRNESKDTAGHQTGDGQAPDSWKYQEDEMAALRGDIVDDILSEMRRMLEREVNLREKQESPPLFEAIPISALRLRFVNIEGTPRSYDRLVHDPGGDGVFGIGSGLRPNNPYPSPAHQHGSEGTPLIENNEGVVYNKGNNAEVRFSSEGFFGSRASMLVEPMFLYSERTSSSKGRLNKGYVKIGGGGLELEVGRDENWLGVGERSAITLTNNAANFDLVKLSSPEPIKAWFFGDLKYTLIFSRFDNTVVNGLERQPYFMAAKLSIKPFPILELGLNYGKQAGGPGFTNSLSQYLKGIVGGNSGTQNTNNLGGLEMRLRLPFLMNAEIYGEFSGEDAAKFWPIVESYVAGVFFPRLSSDGKNDLRFEYFKGNSILYTNGNFPEGYIYKNLPIGASQGGASEEFLVRYRHWFSARNILTLDYIHSERGNLGRLPVNALGQLDLNPATGQLQAVERRNAGRVFWNIPLYNRIDTTIMYGIENIANFNLIGGLRQTNQVTAVDFSLRY